MEAKEVMDIKKSITKHLRDSKLHVIEQQLLRLKSCVATKEFLKLTRIGIFVTDLRKSEEVNENIRTACKELVAKWKSDLSLKVETSAQSTDSKTTNQSIDAEERTAATDRVDLSVKGMDKIRVKCSEILYSALATSSELDSKVILKLVQKLELAVNVTYPTADQYKIRIRTLVANLRDKTNPALRERIWMKELSPESFAVMATEDMVSNARRGLVEEAQKANMAEAVSAKQLHSATDIFRCGNCKKRETTYYQMQTRSADEPMTTFVTCLVCDNRWKFC